MKRICFILSCCLLLLNGHAQDMIYVSTHGNDSNDGSILQPLKTLEAGLKKLKTTKNKKVEILLREGKYHLKHTIDITPEILHGHQLLIKAYRDEQVTVTGTVPFIPKWTAYKDNIMQAAIGSGLQLDQLIMNGKLLSMARYPNYDSTARVFNGTSADALSKERVRSWSDPSGGFVHALHKAEWGDFHYRIMGKTGDSLMMEGGWQNNRPASMHHEYRFVENVFEELDAPGEWYYNIHSGILYFIPSASTDLSSASIERSRLDNLICIKGNEQRPVEGVTVEGITFTGTNRTFMYTSEPLLRSDWTIYRGGAILIEGAENIAIRNCTFTSLGGNAIFISRFNRMDSIEHNHIYDIGGNAIAFVGDPTAVRSPSFRYEDFVAVSKMDMTPGPQSNNYPAQCMAYDNLIHDIGTIEKQVAGIQISMAMDITASHNSIYNVPRSGINIGDGCWGGHIIEYNDVFNTVLETGDHGAFNSWGRDRYWLPGIEDVNKLVAQYPALPFVDAVKPITLRNNRFHCTHGWDIDLDDGSTNYIIYNNLCLNGGLKLREGYQRVVTNNVIVNNTFHPHVWYQKSMDVFSHNIVTSAYAPIRVNSWGKMVDSNFFVQQNGLIHAQRNHTDLNSQSGDPQFVHPSTGDFSVRSTSPALNIGFQNFPMDQFGVVSVSLKRIASRPNILPVQSLEKTEKNAVYNWQGAVIKNIETLGEQSASGLPDKRGVLIVSLTPGSLSEKNGLKPGDVIIKLNENNISNVAELLDLIQTVNWQGHALAVVWRNQQAKTIDLKLK